MRVFATEFEVLPHSKGEFVGLLMEWIKGMRDSSVFSDDHDYENDPNAPVLMGAKGDSLMLQDAQDPVSGNHGQGFRYDVPDGDMIWRTEGVLSRVKGAEHALFRIRGQCLARNGLPELHDPNKPYLIKNLVADAKVCRDGLFTVQAAPHFLSNDTEGLECAALIVEGKSTTYLPVVYVSTLGGTDCQLSDGQIDKLAFDLGGVAHVVREPDRGFSFDLKDLVGGRNVFGGLIGVAVPGQGFVRLLRRHWEDEHSRDLFQAVSRTATSIRSQMASQGGWDWAHLQELHLRKLRQEAKSQPAVVPDDKVWEALLADNEERWEKTMELKDSRIADLEQQLRELQLADAVVQSDGLLDDTFVQSVGPEVFGGEFSDRVLWAIRKVLGDAERLGLDDRSHAVLQAMSNNAEFSGRASGLSTELSKATRDKKRMAKHLGKLLPRYGFEEKSDKNHYRFEPRPGFLGLTTVTFAKTPSESRGLSNQKSQIENNLGLPALKKAGR